MKRLRAKLCARRGETLTEVLCALLVAAMCSLLLATMLSAAARLNKGAHSADEAAYAALSAAEERAGTGEGGSVAVQSGGFRVSFPVTVYGDSLTSYAGRVGG